MIFRHLFCDLDGSTDGPEGPSGPIGTAIKRINQNLRQFIDFERITSNVPAAINRALFEGREDLSILYDLVRGIEDGFASIDLKYVTKGWEILMGVFNMRVTWHSKILVRICFLLTELRRRDSPSIGFGGEFDTLWSNSFEFGI